ncbi:MAG: beta-ketoacyl synthase chain length factor [Neisseria sp.]|nr:beta-ketoacyl synthase chain length factor [Neisseria sp.]
MKPIAAQFSFNILAHRALSTQMADETQWRAWFAGADLSLFEPFKPDLAFLPAMQRRRLGALARLVCQAAWDVNQAFPNLPVVYASHDGEINRSFDLWLSLLKDEGVSPTSFGLSVHNALIGQWSILSGDMAENTALATSADGLENALAECFALLHDGHERVLLLLADEPLKTEFPVVAERAPLPYVLALVLERGDAFTLSLMPSAGGTNGEQNPPEAPYWNALAWLRFMLNDESECTHHYGNRQWIWRKK